MSLSSLFNPKSIAIIGASKTKGKIGNALIKNVIESGYKGKIYPINPKEKEIVGLRCYPGILDVKENIDLAVIAIPAGQTPAVVEQCGQARVKALTVISAGFKEVGREGLLLEKEVLRICRTYSMRLLGPNCVGFMATHTPINASFSGVIPQKGDIAFISQSGAILVAILDWSYKLDIGFSKVISMGNKADLNEADFIEDAADDPQTKVILCYIEDVARGEHFLEAVREASRRKPVIILKSGTSEAGARAASSHTGALVGSNLAYETAFRQAGAIRAHSMAELFDLAVVFARQPVPQGNRVAVVTNAGGPGILTTDNIELRNLRMAGFSKETTDALRKKLPGESAVYNPVDVLGDSGPERYRFALQKVLADKNADCVLVLVCPTAVTDSESIARAIIQVHQEYSAKPLFAVLMGGETMAPGVSLLTRAGIPCFTFPEPAVQAISGMTRYAQVREQPLSKDKIELDNIDTETVKQFLEKAEKEGRLALLSSEGAQVMAAYRIPVAPIVLAVTPEEAAGEAERIGFPVVLKVASSQIVHKTDVGGVITNITSAEEVKRGFLQISENVHRYLPRVVIHGIEVQKMMPGGIELIIGMTRDMQFGPLISFGLGGIYVNLLKDVAFRLAWGLNKKEIQEMIAQTRAYTLLRGYRGKKPADIPAVIDFIARLARLAEDFPEIKEMEINPLFAYPQGAVALDVKIIIG